jgi:hypothetical protein
MLGYRLEAVVTKPAVAAALEEDFPAALAVELPQGFALVPMTRALIGQISGGRPWADVAQLAGGWVRYNADSEVVERSTSQLPHVLANVLASLSRVGAVAYVEAEFFGGSGVQASVVWDVGEIVLGPLIEKEEAPVRGADAAINQALRRLGVQKKEGTFDEFEALDLGRCRKTDDCVPAPDLRTRS